MRNLESRGRRVLFPERARVGRPFNALAEAGLRSVESRIPMGEEL